MEAISLGTVLTALREIAQIVTRFQTYLRERNKKRFEIIEQILAAVARTSDIIRQKEQKTPTGGWEQELAQREIGQLWRSISYEVRQIDPSFSKELFVKGLFWLDKGVGGKSRFVFVISLSEIVRRALGLHPDYGKFLSSENHLKDISEVNTSRAVSAAIALLGKVTPPMDVVVERKVETESVHEAIAFALPILDGGEGDYLYVIDMLQNALAAPEAQTAHKIDKQRAEYLLAVALDGTGQQAQALSKIENLISALSVQEPTVQEAELLARSEDLREHIRSRMLHT
ncbi:hypothetical protein [Sinorhizobium saheli]|uniref:Uncharacterized protein n=1 Tax=Sinorhizobium saheli TaxID=36856 RepID=A0A178XY69_SINSA|nr:hypothetical protein [Sinorhizobium saheli]MQW90129.1 hypothetical protein [Sinorhizobium saheli]OAP40259.1 hypothetical protein ATB98_02125 [Sinorhizobium saheli]